MPESYTCPVCDMTSHNPNDVAYKYCGNCHRFEVECAQQEAIATFTTEYQRCIAELRAVLDQDVSE